jgi:acyl-CoA thioester hydrolase
MNSRDMAGNYNRRTVSERLETQERKLAHAVRIPIRWGDMDAMGHVNNIVYFRYMEQARISWFESLAGAQEAWHSQAIVIANASCNFRRALTYPGTVEVKVFTGRPGGSSVATYYELRLEGDDEPYADGAAVVVFVDVATQKPVRIPQKLRERMQ